MAWVHVHSNYQVADPCFYKTETAIDAVLEINEFKVNVVDAEIGNAAVGDIQPGHFYYPGETPLFKVDVRMPDSEEYDLLLDRIRAVALLVEEGTRLWDVTFATEQWLNLYDWSRVWVGRTYALVNDGLQGGENALSVELATARVVQLEEQIPNSGMMRRFYFSHMVPAFSAHRTSQELATYNVTTGGSGVVVETIESMEYGQASQAFFNKALQTAL